MTTTLDHLQSVHWGLLSRAEYRDGTDRGRQLLDAVGHDVLAAIVAFGGDKPHMAVSAVSPRARLFVEAVRTPSAHAAPVSLDLSGDTVQHALTFRHDYGDIATSKYLRM